MAGLVTHSHDDQVLLESVRCITQSLRDNVVDHELRMVYQMTNSSQKLYYMIGQFDGWLLGPKVGINYGGIKNTHDGMCVQSNPG